MSQVVEVPVKTGKGSSLLVGTLLPSSGRRYLLLGSTDKRVSTKSRKKHKVGAS